MRKLTLNRDVLVELRSDELAVVAGAAEAYTLNGINYCISKIIGCNTADSYCEISQGCG